MKSNSAIKKIENELGVKVKSLFKKRAGERMYVFYKGNYLMFFITNDGDAENFEITKDINLNGFYPSSLKEALILMK